MVTFLKVINFEKLYRNLKFNCTFFGESMKVSNFFFTLLIFLSFIINGCKKESAPNEANPDPVLNKSSKRGIAFNIVSAKDFKAISGGVSWWYNWGKITDKNTPSDYYQTYQMDFIPMLWGGNTNQNDITIVESFILAHTEIKYLLVMNEPNLTDQANRTPSEAASDWLRYEKVVNDLAAKGRTIYLVGPAMNWGTMKNYSDPVVWLDEFYAAYKAANNGRVPKIDYLAFHWYDYGLNAQLDRLQKYGKKIWITEMANWNQQINSYEKQSEQMKEMVNICESRSDVFRYAWFYGRGSQPDKHFTYLFTEKDGELTDLGKLYISLPHNNE